MLVSRNAPESKLVTCVTQGWVKEKREGMGKGEILALIFIHSMQKVPGSLSDFSNEKVLKWWCERQLKETLETCWWCEQLIILTELHQESNSGSGSFTRVHSSVTGDMVARQNKVWSVAPATAAQGFQFDGEVRACWVRPKKAAATKNWWVGQWSELVKGNFMFHHHKGLNACSHNGRAGSISHSCPLSGGEWLLCLEKAGPVKVLRTPENSSFESQVHCWFNSN